MPNEISLFRFFKKTPILKKPSKSFWLFSGKSGQCKKKWSVVSVSEPQSRIGLGASLKLWRNLCSFKWLNFIRSLSNNLPPTGSWITKRDFSFKLFSGTCLVASHSLAQVEEKNCLKCSFIALNLLKLFWFHALVLQVWLLLVFSLSVRYLGVAPFTILWKNIKFWYQLLSSKDCKASSW